VQNASPVTFISPAQRPIVLDNTVVSNLHRAGALSRVLEFWPGQWLVPWQVRDEAAGWPTEGSRVASALEDLRERRVIDFAALEPRVEGSLFARLTRTLGQGEAATVAIAYHRHYVVALNDYPAQRACNRLAPPVPWVVTEVLLQCAVAEGHLILDEARAIWTAVGIRDPKRQIL
jgi:predicted nucleic acid-binding protein